MGRTSLPDSDRHNDGSPQEPSSLASLTSTTSLPRNTETQSRTNWPTLASLVVALLILLFGSNILGKFFRPVDSNLPQAGLTETVQDRPSLGSDQSTGTQRFYSRYSFNRAPFVHPRIIGDLIGWISDTGDQVVAINLLDSQESNRYHGEIDVRRVDNEAGSPWPWVFWLDGVDNGKYGFGRTPFTAYQYLGTTTSGLDVLHVKDSGGGASIFHRLIFVATRDDYGVKYSVHNQDPNNELAFQPQIRTRELVWMVGRIGLGDRWDGSIDVVGNDVVVRGRTLNERCIEGGAMHPYDAAELRYIWRMDCTDDPPEHPPEARVYVAPTQ